MNIDLSHLFLDEEKDETRGIRVFDMLPAIGWAPQPIDGPEENWGAQIEMPQWVLDVHNSQTGRCFLFGTGPSLIDQLPLLGAMTKEYTFTCNRMKKWKDLPFVPWTHCLTEPAPMIAWGADISDVYDYPTAVNKVACSWWPLRGKSLAKGWLWLPKAPDDLQVRWQGTWGLQDYLPPIPTAWASPLTIAQLALWMGFTELYFLGIDTTQEGQAWDKEFGRTAKPRNIRSILECADRVRMDVQMSGRVIFDLTPGGRMSREGVLPYKSLEEVLNASS